MKSSREMLTSIIADSLFLFHHFSPYHQETPLIWPLPMINLLTCRCVWGEGRERRGGDEEDVNTQGGMGESAEEFADVTDRLMTPTRCHCCCCCRCWCSCVVMSTAGIHVQHYGNFPAMLLIQCLITPSCPHKLPWIRLLISPVLCHPVHQFPYQFLKL
jgi:hypothetical protein